MGYFSLIFFALSSSFLLSPARLVSRKISTQTEKAFSVSCNSFRSIDDSDNGDDSCAPSFLPSFLPSHQRARQTSPEFSVRKSLSPQCWKVDFRWRITREGSINRRRHTGVNGPSPCCHSAKELWRLLSGCSFHALRRSSRVRIPSQNSQDDVKM
jgi:hypothetical protein